VSETPDHTTKTLARYLHLRRNQATLSATQLEHMRTLEAAVASMRALPVLDILIAQQIRLPPR
jgi:hypothetical protein